MDWREYLKVHGSIFLLPYIPIRANYILQLHRDLFQYSEKGIGDHFKTRKIILAQQTRRKTNLYSLLR